MNWGQNEKLNSGRPCDRVVLFLPSAESSLKEMLYLGRNLSDSGRFRSTFVIRSPMRNRWLDEIRKQGHELIMTTAAQRSISRAETIQDSCEGSVESALGRWGKQFLKLPKQGFKAIGRWLPLDSIGKYARALRRFHWDREQAADLLTRIRPQLLVTPSDRTLGLETAMLVEARQRSIPSLVIPWCLWTPRSEVYARAERPHCEESVGMTRFMNRFVAKRLAEQTITEGEATYLFAPGETLLAAQRVGILPARPFAFYGGCGLADRVAVESPALRDMCLTRGISPEKIRLTGRAYADVVTAHHRQGNEYRTRLAVELGLRPHHPIVLCAVPNTAEQDLCSWQRHQDDTNQLFRLLQSGGDVNVVLNLHPKSDPQTYQQLADRYRFVISSKPIEDLIPACDVFVSTFSSTIVMAIGCHKPTVNLDIFGANDDAFASCPGIVTVRNWPDAFEALRPMLHDSDHHRRLTEHQRIQSKHWGMFDGRCTDRLAAEIELLVHEHTSKLSQAA